MNKLQLVTHEMLSEKSKSGKKKSEIYVSYDIIMIKKLASIV